MTRKRLPVVASAFLVILFFLTAFPSFPAETPALRDKPNIVLVILDTVRKDYTGQSSTGEVFTPRLNKLAAEGTVFRNAWANAPWTTPSHASFFTGLLPSAHGCIAVGLHLAKEHATMAEILSENGYETAAFFSNPCLTDSASGVLRGFEYKRETSLFDVNKPNLGAPGQIIVDPPPPLPPKVTQKRGDQGGESSCKLASQWLSQRNRKKPFFLFVNILEAHLPYDPPASYREKHLADLPPDDMVSVGWADKFNARLVPPESVDWKRVHRLYRGDVSNADSLLGTILDALAAKGVYEDSIIIVASDHGEQLGEHDLLGHQFSVYETLLAVPLIIRAPQRFPAGVRNEPVMLTDLFATILDLAGVAGAPSPKYSRSLLTLFDKSPSKAGESLLSRPIFSEYGAGEIFAEQMQKLNPKLDTKRFKTAYRTVRVGDMRLTLGSEGSVALYNMAKDPAQDKNVAKAKPDIVKADSALLSEAIGKLTLSKEERKPMDKETEEKLRSLGYIH
jgi:arylsulfatase A-like enzyme